MKLVSINVGRPRLVIHEGRRVSTGIFKSPVDGPVAIHDHHVDGDKQADRAVHGGPDKAVYAYPFEHYAAWARELNRDDLTLGQFGENLTVEGMIEDRVRVGDVYRIGSVELQVSQPRSPCFKLGIRMRTPDFPSTFLKSDRVGFYLRVICEGSINTGDDIVRLSTDKEAMTITDLSRLRFFNRDDIAGAQRAINLPALSDTWRKEFQNRLA